MNAKEYGRMFRNCCEGIKETTQSVDVDFVANFNKQTRWTGMEINLVTREVNESPANVVKTMYFGELDGDVYTAVINFAFSEIYILDFFGEMVESLPLSIDNGVIYGHLQNYLSKEGKKMMKANMNLKEAIRAVVSYGWNLKGVDCYITPYGTVQFISHETWWEVDPETGAYRHRGLGAGCFWTEWEGGESDL